jgi:23S rRNA (cytidine2498-2'-O)-methyltransferase
MLLYYCRAGFEADCAAEVAYHAHQAGAQGRCEYQAGAAHVMWIPAGGRAHDRRAWFADFATLVFARQQISGCVILEHGDDDTLSDRILEAARGASNRYSAVWFEAPDHERARIRLGKLRAHCEAIEAALRESDIVGARRGPRLHVCFLDKDTFAIGRSTLTTTSPWAMGIPRLRFPRGAPSRSGLKLVEALQTFIGERELPQRMRAGRVAIDLGAAPGGWSAALAQRGLRVIAVDNGPIAQAVLATQLVEHRRADAFRFRPDRPVDWMVCDVVAAPARIAALAAQWVERGWCRETIFNLKLPNRDRWQEVLRCQDVIERALSRSAGRHMLRMKHLYHDREEVTAHLRDLG